MIGPQKCFDKETLIAVTLVGTEEIPVSRFKTLGPALIYKNYTTDELASALIHIQIRE